MKKLNLEKIPEAGNFIYPKAGGYVCGIYSVEDVSEKEYLKLTYDIVEGEFKGYYSNRKKEREFELPFFVCSYKDAALPFFKSMITSVENSNKDYKWDNDETKLRGKYIGIIFGEEEYISKSNNKVYTRLISDGYRSVETIRNGDFKIPELKKLENTPVITQDPFSNSSNDNSGVDFFNNNYKSDDFMNIPDGIDEELPFN